MRNCLAQAGWSHTVLEGILLPPPQLHAPDLWQHWLSSRQMRVEGGFQGRSNKLVDGCYSFWQGAAFTIVRQALGSDSTG